MSVRVTCGSGMGVKGGHVVDCLSVMWTAKGTPLLTSAVSREVGGGRLQKNRIGGDEPQQPGKPVHSSVQLGARHGGAAEGMKGPQKVT